MVSFLSLFITIIRNYMFYKTKKKSKTKIYTEIWTRDPESYFVIIHFTRKCISCYLYPWQGTRRPSNMHDISSSVIFLSLVKFEDKQDQINKHSKISTLEKTIISLFIQTEKKEKEICNQVLSVLFTSMISTGVIFRFTVSHCKN